ncbi:MAG TPA: 50S ribosomal protein L13 [Candidatus Onthovivens sp.]|nr:50S ribosomal protein L13 [Candidatus Onthovivens sp.]
MNRETTNLKKEEITRKWYIVDAKDKPLGRLASEIAIVLMGKQKPSWTPNQDCGDFVIVINAGQVACSGKNIMTNKKYYNVSGFPGGLRVRTLETMIKDFPEELMERSVWGMLPKGRLGRQIYKKLFVYEGSEHKHSSQKPEVLTFKSLGGNK